MSKRVEDAVVKGITFFPLGWIVTLYLFTFLCWIKLGHFPIPSLNDPKFIGFSPFYYLSLFGMMTVIFVIAAWLLCLPFTIKKKLINRKHVVIMVVGSILSLIQLFFDPFNLIYWLLD